MPGANLKQNEKGLFFRKVGYTTYDVTKLMKQMYFTNYTYFHLTRVRFYRVVFAYQYWLEYYMQ
jgi:hypothetical protein